eukprot:gene11163-3221_t
MTAPTPYANQRWGRAAPLHPYTLQSIAVHTFSTQQNKSSLHVAPSNRTQNNKKMCRRSSKRLLVSRGWRQRLSWRQHHW